MDNVQELDDGRSIVGDGHTTLGMEMGMVIVMGMVRKEVLT